MNNRVQFEYSLEKNITYLYSNNYFNYCYNNYLDRDIIHFNPKLAILFSIIVTGIFPKMILYILNN